MNEGIFETEMDEYDIFGPGYGDEAGDEIEGWSGDPDSVESEAAEMLFPGMLAYGRRRSRRPNSAIRRALLRAKRHGRYGGYGRYGKYGRPPFRRRYPPPAPPAPQSTRQVGRVAIDNRRAIKNVDLESKVQSDILAQRLAANQKRIGGTEYAMAASKVVDELEERIPELFDNEILKTALPLLPLLFLRPQKKGSGFGSVISDPRVWAPIIAGGVAVAKELLENRNGNGNGDG